MDVIDLWEGFTHYYHSLELSAYDNNSTWTLRILNYFDILGKMLGFDIKIEKNRYDLSWWDHSIEGELFLHLEHENSTNLERIIDKTINKIIESKTIIGIAIVYPKNHMDYQKIFDHIKTTVTNTNAKELLFILDGSCYLDDYAEFYGIIYNRGNSYIKLEHCKKVFDEETKIHRIYSLIRDFENINF